MEFEIDNNNNFDSYTYNTDNIDNTNNTIINSISNINIDEFIKNDKIDNISKNPTIINISVKEQLFIKNSIKHLSKNEHIEIFKIISSDTDKYSENNNGIFINLSKLSNLTLNKIYNFINYCINNKKILEEENNARKSIKNIIDNEKNDCITHESNLNNYIDIDESIKEISYNVQESINKIEEDIINSSHNINKNENYNIKKYTGIRAKIIKKCREKNSSTEII